MDTELFQYDELNALATDHAEQYQNANPFPHIVVDSFLDYGLASIAYDNFPKPSDSSWWKYKNPLEVKLALDRLELLPFIFKRILWELNSGPFVRFLEKLTGIDGLIPDPDYVGGGLHQIERGGKLDIHADFNWHRKLKLDRRINVIVYLNYEWEEEYGGHLELWDREMQHGEKILPAFNRMVCFNTTDFSYHGHPDPLTCPEGETRKSMALYYYTNGRPENERSDPHSTIYKARPQDDPKLEELRKKRAKGRIEDC